MHLTFEWVVSVLIAIITGAFWRWADKLSRADDEINKKLEKLLEQIHSVEKAYQSKSDAEKTNQQITELLKEIQKDVKVLTSEIHKKADKSCQ